MKTVSGTRQKAIVQPGGVIQLKAPELQAGTEVEVLVLVDATAASDSAEDPEHPLASLTPEEVEARVMSVLGDWEGDEEIDRIFAEIDRERHADFGRGIPDLDG